MPSENALRCRLRFVEPTDGVDEAVVEVDAFRLCFDDRAESAEYTELDEFDASEEARDRVRLSVDVAGEESAEKWLPVVYVETERSGRFDPYTFIGAIMGVANIMVTSKQDRLDDRR
jgi:hypothetical protein